MNRSTRRTDWNWRNTGRAFIAVAAGAACLAVVLVIAALLLPSCSARIGATVAPDGGLQLSADVSIPDGLAAKLRNLSSTGSTGSQTAFFDATAIRSALASRAGVNDLSVTQTSPTSVRIGLSARNVDALGSSADLQDSKPFYLVRGSGWTELHLKLERGNAKSLKALVPGLDPDLLEALSPPALEEDPLSPDDYRTMLRSVLGEKTMPAFEAASIDLTLTAPGTILAFGGGTVTGLTLTSRIPILDALTLAKPIEIWLRWKT